MILLKIIGYGILSFISASAAIALLISISTHCFLLFEVRFKLTEEQQYRYLNITIRKFLKSFLWETFYCMVCIWASLFFWLPQDYLSTQQAKTIPILFIHGYFHNRSAWLWFYYKLKQANFTSLFSLNLSPLISLDQSVETIKKRIQQIQTQTNTPDIILIGHSLGGILASNYVENCSPSKIKSVILLGSPIQGTRIANFKLGKNAKDLKLHSPFLTKLSNQMLFSKKSSYYCIGSILDNVVIPWNSSFPSDTFKNTYIVDDLGHLSMLYSTKIVSKVIGLLKVINFGQQ